MNHSSRSSYLQLIALIAMAIDHVGLVFFPEFVSMRVVGRMAFPIFAYGVASGYMVTRDYSRYLRRMLTLAVVSVIPYFLLFRNGLNSIVFTFCVALMVFKAMDMKKYFFVVLLGALFCALNTEMGLYGLSLCLIYRYTYQNKHVGFLLAMAATVAYILNTGLWLQVFAAMAFLSIAYLPELKERLPLSRRAFYVFYPAHLVMLWVLRVALHV